MDVIQSATRLPEGLEDAATGEGLEGDGPDELGGGGRQHHIHRRSRLGQPPGDGAGFVAGDSARHAENDAPAGEGHVSCRRRRTSR